MSRYLNPEWQDLRDKESTAFEGLQKAQSRITATLAGQTLPTAEDLSEFDTNLRKWKAARQEIDAWMTKWLEGQARP